MQQTSGDGDRKLHLTFGWREGLSFGLGFLVSQLLLYGVIVYTLLYVIP